MTQSWICLGWKLRLASAWAVVAMAISGNCAGAQIVPDDTLEAERSVVTPNVDIKGVSSDRIDGGAVRGANLFHSFREFNIEEGRGAYFTNPTRIENILSRVTGSNASNIFGKLGVLGSANLFLINPNGMIFGPNASLDVNGSFVGSTASSLKFADGKEFSATAPQATPLLTVSVPIGLQFGENQGRISVQGNGQGLRLTSDLIDTTVGLRVQPNQTLALIGGDLALEGGTLKTGGGRIELGSVASPSLVSLTPIDKGWALGYEGVQNFRDIQLAQQTAVDASGEGGGDIQVWGRQVTLKDGSQMEASTLGVQRGGDLSVNASELIELSGTSVDNLFASGMTVLVYPEATGAGGNLSLKTGRLILQNGAQVVNAPYGAGSAGTLTVNASDSVELIGTSADGISASSILTAVLPGATGNGGNLSLETGRLIARNGGQVLTSTFGEGAAGTLFVNASESIELVGTSADGEFFSGLLSGVEPGATGNGGNLTLKTGRLIVRDGAQIVSATNSSGNAGNMMVNATEVELSGTAANGGRISALSTSGTRPEATGAGGNLTVETGRLIVRDGAQIQSGTFGTGAAGNLSVKASESVQLIGIRPDSQSPSFSGLFSSVQLGARGAGGNLTIETGKLIIRDGARINAGTRGDGAGGTLSVNASESVQVIGISADGNFPSSLLTNSTGNGDAGAMRILTGQLNVQDGAQVSVRSEGSGKAGNLQLTASSIRLDNNASLTATTRSGNGGDVTLQLQDFLLLRRNSQISSTAGNAQFGGDGGNITIDTPFIVAVPDENSDITANAFSGRGGRVNITAPSIFGIEPRSRQELQNLLGTNNPSELDPSRLSSNDITAISQTNPELSGQVTINSPDVDPEQGLVELPAELIDASNQIASACAADGENKFTITGRGGLPTNPRETLSGEAVLTNWATLTEGSGTKEQGQRSWEQGQRSRGAEEQGGIRHSPSSTIVEATGWVINDKGEVVLTASAPTATLDIPWLPEPDCQAPKPSE